MIPFYNKTQNKIYFPTWSHVVDKQYCDKNLVKTKDDFPFVLNKFDSDKANRLQS